MEQKNVELIIPPGEPHYVGDGFRVHNFIPKTKGLSMHRMDPFIVMDYNSKFYFEPADQPRGVGVHPHKGFETVTIAYQGKVTHHDSSGSGGVIGPGDVQWMTAGAGILHKEYHEANFDFPAYYNTALLVVEGTITINGKEKVATDHLALFGNEGETFEITAEDQAVVLQLSGEPIAAHGPFVMNTRKELMDAFQEFNKGKFGYME